MDVQGTSRTWIGWSFIAGCCTGIPAGIILCYLASMPFYLGLFFFLLLGLLVGATMFRFGRNTGPVRPGVLWLIGAAVALITWSSVLITEYATFPGLVAARVEQSRRRIITPEQKLKNDNQLRRYAMSQLLGHDYDAGVAQWTKGFASYVSWIANDGTMSCPRLSDPSTYNLVMPQRKTSWLFRQVLSLILLGFAVLSQYLLLARSSRMGQKADGQSSANPPSTPSPDTRAGRIP